MADCDETKCVHELRETRQSRSTWNSAILFLVIFGVGLSLRLVHITAESIWWDEFATVAFLEPPPAYPQSPHYERWNQTVIRQPSPTLGTFLRQNRGLDPAAMPMYLSLEYYWNRHVHASPVALRLLSVLIGIAVLPVLFFLGKYLFGVKAGLIAMFCAAVSPIHIQFSKEIRMYGLMTLLAVVAVYAFCRILDNGRKIWWLVYAVSVLLLSWTHPFALLLPFVQGLFWLLAYPRDIRRLFMWGVLTAVMTVPAALWVLGIQFWGQDSTESWLRAPTLIELVNDIFADDAIGATYQLNATPHAFSRVFGADIAGELLRWRWAAGRIMVIAVVFSLAWLLLASTIARNYRHAESPGPRTSLPTGYWGIFLGLWLMAPPLILYVLSLLWRPCHQPRYTVHASLSLYLIVGAAIMMLPKKAMRIMGILGLIVFYGYQQMLMIGEPQHPDWLGASRMIREMGKPDDLILAHNWLWKRVFAYNLGPVPNVVCYGSSHDILAEKSAFFLDLQLSSIANPDEPRQVWIAVRTEYFTRGTIEPLEHELRARNLTFEVEEFGGIQRVILYRVRLSSETGPYRPLPGLDPEAPKEFGDLAMEFWRAQEYETAVLAAQNAIRIDPGYVRAWSYLGMSYKELGRFDEALAAFQQAITLDPMDYPWSLNNYTELLISAGRYEEGVTAAKQALEALSGDPWSLALLGRAYYALGDYAQALEALRQAVAKGSHDHRIQEWLEAVEKTAAETAGNE